MRARQEIFKYTDDSLQRALQHLKNGQDIMGENILFYSGIGNVYYQYFDTKLRTDRDYGALTEEYAKKIFKLDPDSSHGHRLIGLVKLKRDNAYEGYKHLKQAYISDPNDWDTLFWLSYVLMAILGKKSEAVPLVQKVLEIDPLTPSSQSVPAMLNWMEGRFDLALKHFDKWRQMEPDSLVAKWYYAQLLLWNNRVDEANKFIDDFVRESPGHIMIRLLLFLRFAFQKKKKEAYAALNADVKNWAWDDFHLPWYGAECFALLDERQEAIDWLEHAVDRAFINYPLFAELDPFLENIRGEPRFKKLMERVKQEWESFEV
jgi:tetratricopeptide (TPR) repeat protein